MPIFRARAATTACFAANGVAIGAWAASVPVIQSAFALSAPALGGLLLELAAGAIAAMLLAGGIADRMGSARVMRAATWAIAVVLPLPAFAPHAPALGLCIVLLGLSTGTSDVAMNAQASEVERRYGRPIMSSFHAGFSIAGLGGAVFASAFGLALSALPVAGLALAASLLGGVPDPGRPPGERPPRLALPSRSMFGLCLLAGACMAAEGAMADWSGIYMRDFANAPARFAGLGFAAFSLAMTLGRLGGDAVVRRIGRQVTIRLGGLVAAVGLGLALAVPAIGPAAAGFLLVGLGLANVVPAVYSAGAATGLVPPATGIAMVATVGYGGFLLGPPAIGGVAGLLGLRAALVLVVGACLLVAALSRRVANGPNLVDGI